MKKFLLSLILVTPLVCESILGKTLTSVSRCENDEVVCYLYINKAMYCKFKAEKS